MSLELSEPFIFYTNATAPFSPVIFFPLLPGRTSAQRSYTRLKIVHWTILPSVASHLFVTGVRSLWFHKQNKPGLGPTCFVYGAKGDRTPGLSVANAALSQLSYDPDYLVRF